jgi:hypothetical protein
MLGEHVDESDLAGLLSKTADHVSVGISPPRHCERNLVPLRIGLCGGQVKVATLRAVDLGGLWHWVHIGTWLYISCLLFVNLPHECLDRTSELCLCQQIKQWDRRAHLCSYPEGGGSGRKPARKTRPSNRLWCCGQPPQKASNNDEACRVSGGVAGQMLASTKLMNAGSECVLSFLNCFEIIIYFLFNFNNNTHILCSTYSSSLSECKSLFVSMILETVSSTIVSWVSTRFVVRLIFPFTFWLRGLWLRFVLIIRCYGV